MKQISVSTNNINSTIAVGMKEANKTFHIVKEISLIENSNLWWEIIIKGTPREIFTA